MWRKVAVGVVVVVGAAYLLWGAGDAGPSDFETEQAFRRYDDLRAECVDQEKAAWTQAHNGRPASLMDASELYAIGEDCRQWAASQVR